MGGKVKGSIFVPVEGPFGAETEAIDLGRPLDGATVEAIRAGFLEHAVLVFRGQSPADDHLVALGAIFGPLERHLIQKADGNIMEAVHTITNFDASGRPSKRPYINTNYFWHSDKSYLATPSLLTMLHPVELPPEGGDTQFAHMGLACAALAEETRRRIEGRKAVHSLEFMRDSLDNPPPSEEQKRAAPPIAHPIIRPHAETGQPCLYIGMYASHIEGLPVETGRMILARLQEFATQPPFLYTHRWRPGDVVIWDNRCLMHRAIANYDMAASRRVLKRVCVQDIKAAA